VAYTNNNRNKFANIYLEPMTREEAFRKVAEYIKNNKYHYQISINVSKLVYAQKDEKLLKAINSADIINADGMPIKIITQIISGKYTARMGGLDYMEGLAKKYPYLKYYFWGATKEVVEKVIKYYKNKINVVGWRSGYFKKKELELIIKNINSKEIDILYLAMGTPQKEYMLYDLRDTLKCRFAIGVGGAFNIIAGKQKRAPQWIQDIGMEWFYRLCQEPRRLWKRYLGTIAIFFLLFIKEVFKGTLKIKRFSK
jgi:N-acetylglucosaminyldiphosphoundecaprenol N-acetyl-beta-D-mannosaminyltransferase